MNGDAAGRDVSHLFDDEVDAGVQGAEVLEGARRPGEVELPEIGGEVGHVEVAIRHSVEEEVGRAEEGDVESVEAAGVLLSCVGPTGGSGLGGWKVGSEDLAADLGECGDERFLADPEPEASLPRTEDTAFFEGVRDEEPLPHLSVDHDGTWVEVVGVPGGPEPVGPGEEGVGCEGVVGAEL